MTRYLNLVLRLSIWFLLTADLSPANVAIGLAVSFLLPYGYPRTSSLRDWLQALGKILKAVPQAYLEALEIMLWPHTQEAIAMEQVSPRRAPGLVFLDIFLITFTPKTIVLRYHERGLYEVHVLQREQRP